MCLNHWESWAWTAKKNRQQQVTRCGLTQTWLGFQDVKINPCQCNSKNHVSLLDKEESRFINLVYIFEGSLFRRHSSSDQKPLLSLSIHRGCRKQLWSLSFLHFFFFFSSPESHLLHSVSGSCPSLIRSLWRSLALCSDGFIMAVCWPSVLQQGCATVPAGPQWISQHYQQVPVSISLQGGHCIPNCFQ